jgi:hypothetical protein
MEEKMEEEDMDLDEGQDDAADYSYEDMDGDHDSAMTSVGWGTDEDYGVYGWDD